MPVHNHGAEDGDGLACRERQVNGGLVGACLLQNDHRTRLALAFHDAPTSFMADWDDLYLLADIAIRELQQQR